MKKILIIALGVWGLCTVAFSQRVLDYRDQTQALSVFSDKDPEVINAGGAQAGITVFCTNTLSLSFESNVDRTVDVYNKEERGGLTYYYIRFTVGRFRGTNYAGRVLEVLASGFLPLKVRIDLQPSESKSYEIYDPNATVGVGCFYENFNAASELYRNSNYAEAKERFNLSKECTDYQQSANVAYILESIDSILVLRTRGDYYFNSQNYNEALNAYQKVIGYNSSDQYAVARSRESRDKINELCTNYFSEAESYFYQSKYREAAPLYEKMLALSCSNNREANLRLLELRRYLSDREQKAQVVLYEIAQNTPIGLSYGRYTQDKFSTYISLRFNPALFQAISKKEDPDQKGEVNLSFGWNRMVIKEVGFFAGLGYTGVGKWDYEDLDDDGKPPFALNHAVSPEAGVLFKLGPVALRYTFQYRFALDGDQEYIGKIRHVGGIGICF
jgi:tetratricopeptide (TPR) repeat protein